MAKKINQEDDTKFLKEFEKLKAKHPGHTGLPYSA